MPPEDADRAGTAGPMADVWPTAAWSWWNSRRRRSWWCLARVYAPMAPSGVTDAAVFIEYGVTHQGKTPRERGFFGPCGLSVRCIGPKAVRAGNPALRPASMAQPQ